MPQQRDKHRGHAVEAGDFLLVDARQGGLGGEIRQRHQRGAVSHARSHRQHHSETMEHRHLDHHAVGGGQVHPIADAFAVVDHAVVGEHHALGEPCGTRGILHIADIMDVHGGGAAAQFLHGDALGALQCVLPRDGPLLAIAHGDDVAQERQLAGVELLPRTRLRQFGAELGDDARIVGVPPALLQHQCVGVGLLEQILRLGDLVGGVDRD